MATRVLQGFLRCSFSSNLALRTINFCTISFQKSVLPASSILYTTHHNFTSVLSVPTRSSTIFTHLTSDVIWEGVTGPKGSTKKRARGKRRVTRPKIDLNRGQMVGCNREGYLWPGLNAPLYDQALLRKVHKGDVDETYLKRLEDLRNKSGVKRKRVKLPPLLRGWTGASMGGQSLGPLEGGSPGFDTRVLELKAVSTMTATVGRYRRFSALVAAGNGQGVCGIGRGKSVSMHSALKRAKNRAFLNLTSFDLKENRTLWHLGHVREWHTTIFASPKPEGYGLVCHRVIKTLCDVIGIKDLHAKVEGNTKNYLAVVRGFLRLLHEQESYKDLSNRLGLHVVEFNKDYNLVPRVLASPNTGLTTNLQGGLKSDPLLRAGRPPRAPKFSATCKPATDLVDLHAFWSKSKKPPVLTITNPNPRPRVHVKPDEEFDPIDELIEAEDDELEESVQALLERGERDLDTLVTLKGLQPNIKKNPPPYYLTSPGVLKRQAERHRYRNQETSRRERLVYASLDQTI